MTEKILDTIALLSVIMTKIPYAVIVYSSHFLPRIPMHVHSVTVNNFVTEGTYRNGGDTSPYILVFIRKGNITNCSLSATMNDRTTWTCSREFEALHTIECIYIGNFHQAWRCLLCCEVSPPLRKSTPLQHENLLYLSFPFSYNDYFTESNLVDTPICNKAISIRFYQHA